MIPLGQAALQPAMLLIWGLVLGVLGLSLRLAPAWRWRRVGTLLAVAGVVVMGGSLPPLGEVVGQVVFWLMAVVAVVGSGAAITSRSPVYAAIWFAVSLLGTAGLFLLQGAHFLGVATIVVYAGAIVVTFLFVLMLAQPDGHASYDRMSWAGFAAPLAAAATALLLGVLLTSLPAFPDRGGPRDVLDASHVARLGGELFARHLISVEVAGTLLLVALVGAIAIVIQGRPRRAASANEGEANR